LRSRDVTKIRVVAIRDLGWTVGATSSVVGPTEGNYRDENKNEKSFACHDRAEFAPPLTVEFAPLRNNTKKKKENKKKEKERKKEGGGRRERVMGGERREKDKITERMISNTHEKHLTFSMMREKINEFDIKSIAHSDANTKHCL
jgi:hypothetical protein